MSLGLSGGRGEPRLRKKGKAFQAKATPPAKEGRQESTWLGHPRTYFVDIVLLAKAVKVGWEDRNGFHVTQPGHSSLTLFLSGSRPNAELTSTSCHGAVWKLWGRDRSCLLFSLLLLWLCLAD